MIWIAHRGNLEGPNKERENEPSYLKEAIEAGYDVEVDGVIGKATKMAWDLAINQQYAAEYDFYYEPNTAEK